MSDPYIYPGSRVLINKLGIRDQEQLDAAEAAVTSLRMKQLKLNPLEGNFDYRHFCDVHKHIFQDLYEWAGQPRTIGIQKSERVLGGLSVEYTYPDAIPVVAEDVLKRMNGRSWNSLSWEEKVNAFSKDMADLWRVHAFREGNTRTTVIFCCDFAEKHGIPIDRGLFAAQSVYLRDSLVAHCAVFDDLGDLSQPQHLKRIVEGAMLRGAEQQELSNKRGNMTMDSWQSQIAQERQKKDGRFGEQKGKSGSVQNKTER